MSEDSAVCDDVKARVPAYADPIAGNLLAGCNEGKFMMAS